MSDATSILATAEATRLMHERDRVNNDHSRHLAVGYYGQSTGLRSRQDLTDDPLLNRIWRAEAARDQRVTDVYALLRLWGILPIGQRNGETAYYASSIHDAIRKYDRAHPEVLAEFRSALDAADHDRQDVIRVPTSGWFSAGELERFEPLEALAKSLNVTTRDLMRDAGFPGPKRRPPHGGDGWRVRDVLDFIARRTPEDA